MKAISTITIGLAVVGLVCVTACQEKVKDEREIIRPVRYQEVVSFGGEQSRTFSGVSRAAMEVELSFKVGGTVRSIGVKVGDRVKKGAPVAEIDSTDYRLKTEQARAAVANARAQMQNARAAFERTSALYENNNASLHEYERAKAAYDSARAAVTSAQRGLQLNASQVGYTRLTAPMDGIVTRVSVENNENVTPGRVVAVLNSGSDIEVTIGVPESYISRVKEGTQARVTFPSLEGKAFEGVITEVSFTISSASSTYPVSVALKSPSREIRPGMAANVELSFEVDEKRAGIVVPAHAVAEDQKGRFVYTVTAGEKELATVHRKAVEVGELTSGGLTIRKGLEDGELIVTAGVSKLTDGMRVRLLK